MENVTSKNLTKNTQWKITHDNAWWKMLDKNALLKTSYKKCLIKIPFEKCPRKIPDKYSNKKILFKNTQYQMPDEKLPIKGAWRNLLNKKCLRKHAQWKFPMKTAWGTFYTTQYNLHSAQCNFHSVHFAHCALCKVQHSQYCLVVSACGHSLTNVAGFVHTQSDPTLHCTALQCTALY